jgi:hypothetical protein
LWEREGLEHGGRPEGAAKSRDGYVCRYFLAMRVGMDSTNRAKLVVASSLQNDKIKKSYMLSLSLSLSHS